MQRLISQTTRQFLVEGKTNACLNVALPACINASGNLTCGELYPHKYWLALADTEGTGPAFGPAICCCESSNLATAQFSTPSIVLHLRSVLYLAVGLQDWKQANMMFAARDRGALIFEAFSNSPPWFMTISGVPRYDDSVTCVLLLDVLFVTLICATAL